MTDPDRLDQGFGFHVLVDGDWTAVADVSAAQRQMRLAAGSADEKAQAAILAAWKVGDRAIQERQDVFLAKIAKARAAGTPVTEAWLYQVARLDQLRAQVSSQYAALGVVTNAQVAKAQRAAAGNAIDATQGLLEAQFYRSFDGMTDAEIRAWSEGGGGKGPPVRLDYAAQDVYNATTSIVGMVQTGAPLRDLTFSNLSVAGADSVANALVAGATRGASIQDIARSMNLERNLTLARAQTIARTEILRANRLASLQTMRTTTITTPNGTMKATKGWKWSVAPGGRNTCGVCLSLAGSVHPVTEDFQSHPNCRCSPVPITPTWEEMGFDGIDDAIPRVEDGADLIGKLSPEQLRQAFGPTRADLITQGYLKPADLTTMVNRGRWGEQPRLTSVKDAQAIAQVRGYVPPAKAPKPGSGGMAGPAPEPEREAVDPADVKALLVSKDHPLARELDALHADLKGKWDQVGELGRQQQALNQSPDRWTPEGSARYSALERQRQALMQQAKDSVGGTANRIQDERDVAVNRIMELGKGLTPEQARELAAHHEALGAFEAEMRMRGQALGPSYAGPGRAWTNLMDSTFYRQRDVKAGLTWNLPILERLGGNRPVRGQAVQAGAKTTWAGKGLAQAQATWDQMLSIADWQERTFGWRTQWNGRVERGVRGSRGAAGVFHWDDAIGLKADYIEGGRGLKVQLHELFHGMSGGGTRLGQGEYTFAQGWEEGTVERCAQVFERQATIAAGKPWNGPAYTTYEKYTRPLEAIRGTLGMDETEFYTRLIKVRARDRKATVTEWARDRGVDPSTLSFRGLGG